MAGIRLAAPEGPDPAPDGRLAEALGRLPDEQREVILLKVQEDLTFKEIAAVCGVSGNTAASRYRYGLARLRESLEIDHDGR
jgi:RNA polymerase sigma-70 factor (ECF subfamily)